MRQQLARTVIARRREPPPKEWRPPRVRDIRTGPLSKPIVRPLTDAEPVNLLFRRDDRISDATFDEHIRAFLIDRDLGDEMGQPSTSLRVLGKAMFVIEHVGEAFQDQGAREYVVLKMIKLAQDFGEAEGIAIVNAALVRYENSVSVKRAAAAALGEIGFADDLARVTELMRSDPEGAAAYTSAVENLGQRYPDILM